MSWTNISFDLSALKVLIKKIFPPKKSVFTVDTTGDGTIDSLQIKAINVVVPFTIPKKIEYGDFSLENFDFNEFNFSDYGKMKLDDIEISISKRDVYQQVIQEGISIYHKGEPFKLSDILEGKMSGRTIAMGDSISILIKLESGDLQKLTEGKHIFTIEGEKIPKLDIHFELNNKNMNLKFDPNSA